MDPARVADLERRLGHAFRDPALLERALTHASWGEGQPLPHNEGLAFLGDAVLSLVVAEHLLAESPEGAVGLLTSRRAALVSAANLARWAAELELGGLIRLGRGEERTGGRSRESILATALEAVLGVVYLERGLEGVRGTVGRLAVW